MSYADKKTDEELEKLEKKIIKEYNKAAKDVDGIHHQYFYGYDEVVGDKKIHHKGFEERDAELKQLLDAGLYPTPSGASEGLTAEQHYKQWRMNQIGRGSRWEKLKDETVKRIYQANETAAAYVNDTTPGIYSLNANYTAYEIEQMSGVALNIVNEQTIKELMQDENFSEFRVLRTNKKRDYEWNKSKIQSALMQGIMQGDSIKGLSERYLDVMKSNRAAAIRNARTSFTSAQNAGRQSEYKAAEDIGIDVMKVWKATTDARTRDSHIKINGETVKIDETFSNGLEFPGDPNGAPAEVYNCRCTLKPFYPKYQSGNQRNINENYYDITSPILLKAKDKKTEIKTPRKLSKNMSEDEIVKKIGAADDFGYCASQTLAYLGNEYGYDVLDMKDKKTGKFIIDNFWMARWTHGVDSATKTSYDELKNAKSLLSNIEENKEYILMTMKHCSLVRKKDGVIKMLELQTEENNGWIDMDKYYGDIDGTLKMRFGCRKSDEFSSTTIIDVESFVKTSTFKTLLGIINSK